MTITILLVPANLKVRKEALHSFIERHAMLSEFVPLEVILEIRWSKPMPVDHGLSYRAVTSSGIRFAFKMLPEQRGPIDQEVRSEIGTNRLSVAAV